MGDVDVRIARLRRRSRVYGVVSWVLTLGGLAWVLASAFLHPSRAGVVLVAFALVVTSAVLTIKHQVWLMEAREQEHRALLRGMVLADPSRRDPEDLPD